MAAKKRLDILDRVWKQKPTPNNEWPGTPSEFLSFLGVRRKKLATTSYTAYDTLDGLHNRAIVSLGAAVHFAGTAREKYSWSYQCKKTGDYWRAGERVQASARTREEASLRALLVLWELITRRQA